MHVRSRIDLYLIVAHAGLAAALVKVHIGLVDEHVASTERREELALELVLHVDGVAQARVVRVVSRRTFVAAIRPVSLLSV